MKVIVVEELIQIAACGHLRSARVFPVIRVAIVKRIRGDVEIALGFRRASPVRDAVIHVIRVGDWAWGVQFHPEFTTTIITAILRERAQILDEVMGLGYAKHQERNLQPARPATLLLNQFVQLCRQKTTTV